MDMTSHHITYITLHYIQYIHKIHKIHDIHCRSTDFFGFPVLSVFLASCSILEFEPLIFHGICNGLLFQLFMLNGILQLGFT